MNSLGMSIMISHPGAGSIERQIQLFAEVGFDSFFLSSGVTEAYERIPEWAEAAAHHGIRLEAVHLPSGLLDAMWGTDGEKAEKALKEYGRILLFCGNGRVEKAVLHAATRYSDPVTEAGRERFARLEKTAKENGVRLCYENSDTPEHLDALLTRADPFHGFCLDTGHRNCYTPEDDLLARYGDRLLYTHLHDNDGRSDLHYLPFDGTVDWNETAGALKKCGYRGTLNTELAANFPSYRLTDYTDFCTEAYRRLKRLQTL